MRSLVSPDRAQCKLAPPMRVLLPMLRPLVALLALAWCAPARADGVIATDPAPSTPLAPSPAAPGTTPAVPGGPPSPAPTLTVAAPGPSTPLTSPTVAERPAGPVLSTRIEPRGYRFYGWQTMVVEGLGSAGVAAAVLASVGGSHDGEITAIGTLGGLTYVLGGFFVQVFHDSWPKAGGSIAFTTGLPLTGALLGLAAGAAHCPDKGCRERSAGWGAAIGVLSAPIIDGLALGWQKKRDTYHGARGGIFASIAPTVIPVRSGAAFGVGGVLF